MRPEAINCLSIYFKTKYLPSVLCFVLICPQSTRYVGAIPDFAPKTMNRNTFLWETGTYIRSPTPGRLSVEASTRQSFCPVFLPRFPFRGISPSRLHVVRKLWRCIWGMCTFSITIERNLFVLYICTRIYYNQIKSNRHNNYIDACVQSDKIPGQKSMHL